MQVFRGPEQQWSCFLLAFLKRLLQFYISFSFLIWISARNPRQLRDKSWWSSWKKPGETRKRLSIRTFLQSHPSPTATFQFLKPTINSGTVGKRGIFYVFLLCQQQLEQLQKELNFLEDDIKRVEVNSQTRFHPFLAPQTWYYQTACSGTGL